MEVITSRGAIEEGWCSIKHALHVEGHLEEMIANAARDHPEDVLDLGRKLAEAQRMRRELVLKYCGACPSSAPTNPGCPRCQEDLNPAESTCPGSMERTDHYCVEEIESKGKFDRKSFRTIIQDEHRIVIGCPKGKYDKAAQICRVGTKAQAILHPIGE